MKKINLKGDVVSDRVGKLFDWFDLDAIYPKKVRDIFDNLNDEDVEVIMTTNGGSVFAGQEIYDIVKSHKGKTTLKVSGLVASIGTLISCAFDEVLISPVGTFMIHNPRIGEVSGEKKDMEKATQLLATIEQTLISAYSKKTGMQTEELAELMDKETFMNASEAVERGFVDGVIEETENNLMLVASHDSLINSSFIEKLEKLKNEKEKERAETRLRFLELQEGK